MSAPQSPGAAGGHFAVDLDRAPQAIKDLEGALDQLYELREQALSLGRVVPPARDQVSADAARAFEMAAVGGEKSLLRALDAGIEQLTGLIASMNDELRQYSGTETVNERAFRSRQG